MYMSLVMKLTIETRAITNPQLANIGELRVIFFSAATHKTSIRTTISPHRLIQNSDNFIQYCIPAHKSGPTQS